MRKAKRGKEERRQWDEESRGEEWSADERSGEERRGKERRREGRKAGLDVLAWRQGLQHMFLSTLVQAGKDSDTNYYSSC